MRAIETIQADIRKLEAVQAMVRAEMAPLQARAESLYQSLNKLREELSEAEVAAQAKSPTTDWAWVMRCNGGHGMAHYRAGQKAIESLGLMMSGRWSETGDAAAQLVMYRDDPDSVAEMRRAIETLVPHMKVWKDGWLRFGVFEHTLSEYGVFQFEVLPDLSAARVTQTTYGRESVEFEGTLDEALTRVQARHYYQERRDDQD